MTVSRQYLVSLISQTRSNLDVAEVVVYQEHGLKSERYGNFRRALVGDLSHAGDKVWRPRMGRIRHSQDRDEGLSHLAASFSYTVVVQFVSLYSQRFTTGSG